MAWREIERRNGTIGDADLFPGCRLLVTCSTCGRQKGYAPGKVLLRLRQLGMGGTLATFEQIAGRIDRRCACGALAWRAELAYPPGVSDSDIKRFAAQARN